MPAPFKPQGVSAGLWQRLKERVLQEKGPSNAPTIGPLGQVGPAVPPQRFDPSDDQALDQSLWGRIVDLSKSIFGPKKPEEMAVKPDEGPLDVATIKYRIRMAGRLHVLLLMRYNGVVRHVEPYSFRVKREGAEPLFYGHCRLHDHIEAYRLDRIEGCWVTDEPFMPRWPIEVA